MTLKERFGLSTDRGMDYQAALFLALAIASDIDGEWKQYITIAALATMAVVAFFTRGSGIDPHEGPAIKDQAIEPTDEQVADALRKVRHD